MEKMMEEVLKKKKPDPNMDPMKKKAKMGVLKEIMDMAGNDMGEDLKGMKKVTVASPDKEGLEVGLDKAKEMVSSKEGPMDEESMMEMKQYVESCDMTPEQIDEMIKVLEAKKHSSM